MADGTEFSLKSYDTYKVVLGDELRGERATIGKSLLDVQRDLRIKAVYIAAIENCDIEAFPNKGYIAGYVRSYARYLKLDPEKVFERFCLESNFSPSTNSDKLFKSKEKFSDNKKQLTENISWKPSEVGLLDYSNKLNIISIFVKSSPLLVLLLVLIGLSFGTVSILKDIQKLDLIAFEESPAPDFQNKDLIAELSPYNELNFDSSKYSEVETLVNLYSSQELSSPIIEPRDGAISLLEPEKLSALNFLNTKSNNPEKTLSNADKSVKTKIEPVLVKEEKLPTAAIFATSPAWIRLTDSEGTIVLEKTLKSGEKHFFEKNLFSGSLRSGNAQNVYFLIDGKAYGPLSSNSTVAKKVSLNPEVVKIKYFLSDKINDLIDKLEVSNDLIDTAQISD